MTDPATEGNERLLRDRSLAFFGAITASVSHELNNVISIINQNAGLLDDMIIGAARGRPIDEERLGRLADTVKRQTDRGITIIRRLNKFAHGVDEPVREFDVGEVTANFVDLMQRLANLKRSSIVLGKPDGKLMMTGNPFMIQQALFLAVTNLLGLVEEDEPVRADLDTDGDGIRLRVGCRTPPGGEAPSQEEFLELLLGLLGGSVESSSDGGLRTIEIRLPAEPA